MWLVKVLLTLLVAVPFAVGGTIALWPMWRWIEERFAIESVGHSAPAGWCFVVTYAVTVLAGLLLFALPGPGKRPLSP